MTSTTASFRRLRMIPPLWRAAPAELEHYTLLRATPVASVTPSSWGNSGRGLAHRSSLEVVPGSGRAVRRVARHRVRRGPRPGRPERIREVDADQGALRLSPTGPGRDR